MDWGVSRDAATFWTAVSTVVALFAVVVAILLHMNERIKDRRQRHVESMLKFAEDFYADERMSQLFLRIQSGRLPRRNIDRRGSPDELALAHLLEYLNVVGVALERKLVTVNSIAATSMGYIVLTTSRNETVSYYLSHIQSEHAKKFMPSPGWPQFVYLAQRLAIYANKHRHNKPDLRPWYARLVAPHRRRHVRQVKAVENTDFDWRPREPKA